MASVMSKLGFASFSIAIAAVVLPRRRPFFPEEMPQRTAEQLGTLFRAAVTLVTVRQKAFLRS
jgi:hypothetical protein